MNKYILSKRNTIIKLNTDTLDVDFVENSYDINRVWFIEEDSIFVRENKELIRHRMFMTKLKAGCEEEYKRRHDGLIAQRGDTVDPGPDSNFSIWCAGGYIFGYDEIDTTMEVEETVESREQTVEWEMRQLGIMDWITNDVDWMTGDVHADVKRLAWHN